MVIFGALGDLSRRKLLPAIYQLMTEHLVDAEFARARRRPRRDADRRRPSASRCARRSASPTRSSGVDDELWEELCKRLFFVCADLTKRRRLRDRRQASRRDRERARPSEERNRLFYLAVPPSVFEPIVKNLSMSGLAPRTDDADERPWVRVVVEKPFGRSLESAQRAERSRARPVRRASDLSHRSLPRQGDGAERPRAAVRQLDLRADVEPAVDRSRADHRGGDGRRRGARQVLRGSGRRARHVPEPPAAAARRSRRWSRRRR